MPVDPAIFDYDAALNACASGDKNALHRIYQQECSRMLGVALRIVRQPQLAEDVVHDTFINIWTKSGSFDPERGSGRGWIYTAVRNQALNVVRNGAREVSADEEAMEAIEAAALPSTAAGMADAFDVSGSLGQLNTCLGKLDTGKRNCIMYAYLDGCSHGEIAERLNMPLGTVKAWIKRGMNALRECMA